MGVVGRGDPVIAGLLKHPAALPVTNPLVNSYKRLVRYEAPTNVAWSMRNRSPLVRIPDRRGIAPAASSACPIPRRTRISPCGTAAAGLDGIERKLTPPDPVTRTSSL